MERLGYAQLKLYDGYLEIVSGRNREIHGEAEGVETGYDAANSKKPRPDSPRSEITAAASFPKSADHES